MHETPDRSWTTFLVVLIFVFLVVVGLTMTYEARGPGRAATNRSST